MKTNKIILVTGARGFVGRNCLGALVKRGYEVHAVSGRVISAQDNIAWHSADLLDFAAQEHLIRTVKPNIILHSAWYSEHGKFWNAPENKDWLKASVNLFNRAIQQGVERIVGVGSCAEYNWDRSDFTPWKETDACTPNTLYGQSKLLLKDMLEKSSISYGWARLFFLFGAHENPARLVPSIICALLKNEYAFCTSGKQIRDFINVRDAGNILALLADSEIQGVINVASGKPVSIAQMAETLGKIMGKSELIKLGALPNRENDPPFIVADTTRLFSELRYTHLFSEQRLKETINWWQENSLLENVATKGE